MKKIFINIQAKIDFFDKDYKWAFLDINKKYDVEIINYYIRGKISDNEINELKKSGVNMIEYFNEKDLINNINSLNKKNINFYVNTYTENLIPITNDIKKILGQNITKQPELFRNKKLQRELFLKGNKKIGTNFRKINIKNIDFSEIEKEFGLPFVIKPSNGVQSAGVSIINNKDEYLEYVNNFNDFLIKFSEKSKIEDLEIIVEEYIDGKKYAIDYFVDENGKITGITDPIFIHSADNIGIDDLFEFMVIASKDIIKYISKEELHSFLKMTILASGIRNTFLHHEFKVTTKGLLKIIELNGRIGCCRTKMYKESSNINLLDFLFENKGYKGMDNNFIVIQIYSETKGILKGFNIPMINEIKKLESFYSLDLLDNQIGKKVGLTKEGYSRVGFLRFKNLSNKIINNDMDFIRKVYKDLLILE